MSTTDNPNDPALGHGSDSTPVPQNDKYLVLSDAERAKGFTRPYRDAYRHVGTKPNNPLRALTADEHTRYDQYGYIAFEKYPDEQLPITGRYWTQQQLTDLGCGQITTMGRQIAETYAANPRFYGSTYCTTCQKHRPVGEFTWYEMDGTEGPVVGT